MARRARGTAALHGAALAALASVCAALLLGAASAREAQPAAPAQRVVSLNPSLTAITVALGARDVLVGVDSFSARQQPEVEGLPTVGGLYNPSLEAVIALRPDLVVFVPSAEQRGFQRQLEEMGLPVEAFDPVSFSEVLATIRRLGARVGRAEEAEARVAAILAARAEVEAAAAGRRRVRAVLVLQRDPLFIVGRGSFADEMLRAAGAENLGDVFEEPYPRVSREWLLSARPELILDSSNAPEGDDPRAWWQRWRSIPAVAEGHVVDVPPGEVTLPGPHLDRALRFLGAAVRDAGTGS